MPVFSVVYSRVWDLWASLEGWSRFASRAPTTQVALASHSFTVSSLDPDAICRPSGENATASTQRECPASV